MQLSFDIIGPSEVLALLLGIAGRTWKKKRKKGKKRKERKEKGGKLTERWKMMMERKLFLEENSEK